MAKYTVTIKSLIDNKFDFKLNSYPIFDESYRSILNNNILNHYYENEIGFETAPLFRFYLNQKLNEIMPYYNELYKVQRKIIQSDNLLNNVNLTETFESEQEGNATSNSSNTGTNKSKNLFQDTPQGKIKNADINNYEYATNITLDKNESINNILDHSNTSGTSNYIKRIIGSNGNKYSVDVLQQVKDNLMNIDLMIINELNDLFMGIY